MFVAQALFLPIMVINRVRKVSAKKAAICLIVSLFTLLTLQISATDNSEDFFFIPLTNEGDTTTPSKQNGDTSKLQVSDTSGKKTTTKINIIDTLKISKDSLDAPVKYAAEDSGVLIIPERKFLLYSKASVDYKDLNVKAATIEYDQQLQTMKAFGGVDTSKGVLNKAEFSQGEQKSISDSIFYNLKSQKGLTKNTFYNEGEIYVNAERIKKAEADVAYVFRGRFTTCNLDTPHFAFRARKMKLISQKIGVSGPAGAEIEGVPLPVGIPFGIYPLNQGRHSGFLPPQFAATEDFGLGLEGLGYYKVINDNLDVIVRANVYSYGGWTAFINPKYMKRYRYTGGLNLTIQNTKILNRNLGSSIKQEFITNSSFMINWTHSRDPRARPGTNFTASVNAGSTRFNQFVTNNVNTNFQNQLSSSISYSKTWGEGKYNFTASANHNQNNQSRLINLNLPTVNFNVVTFYPFQKKEQIGTPKWYEKIGIGYSGNLQNQISFFDSAASIRKLLDTAQWGASHQIPITLSLPSLGPVTIAPNVGLEMRWYGQKIFRTWNSSTNKVDTTIKRGFFPAIDMNFGISANTRIFGTYNFKKGKVRAIRHEIRPQFSLNYKPDFASKYYYNTQVDTFKNVIRYSQFDGGMYGPFGEGTFGGIGFGIDNLLEMKVRDKKDTTAGATKKIKLIDGFGFSSSYNLVNDSMPLKDFNLYVRSNLFEKINITANAILSPYKYNEAGFKTKEYAWKGGKFSPGTITGGNIAISTQFQSKAKDGDKKKETIPQDQFMTPDEQQRQLDYARQNPAEFTDFNIPWSVGLAFAYSFSRNFDASQGKFVTTSNANVSVNGDFNLSPKWKLGGNAYYDFTTGKIQSMSVFVTREMHCWQMAINVTPIGPFRSFNISISPKSGILRDLRINRNRFFYNQ